MNQIFHLDGNEIISLGSISTAHSLIVGRQGSQSRASKLPAKLSGALSSFQPNHPPLRKNFRNLSLKQLAEDTDANMADWYNRTYRIACEPAHITDLSEYVPPAKGPINLTQPRQISAFRVYVALDFALQIMCDLLKNISDMYELGFTEAILELKTKLDATRPLPMV
jgi:hypothetical protein